MRSRRSVLLIEDDRIDQMSVTRAFRDLKIANRLEISGDGEAGLERLRSKAEIPPCLVLLDLVMPLKDGTEVLQEMKSDPDLKRIPVVMMTSSREEEDRVRSFNLGAAGYIIKPVDYRQLVEAIRTIDIYWTLSETAE